MTSIGYRLKQERERGGKTPREIAHAMQIPLQTYYDLEDDDSLYQVVSLGELHRLLQALRIPLRNLLEPSAVLAGDTMPATNFDDVRRALNAYLKERSRSVEQFEDIVGWTIGGFLTDPAVAWDWNIDCVRDICRELKIHWVALLSNVLERPK